MKTLLLSLLLTLPVLGETYYAVSLANGKVIRATSLRVNHIESRQVIDGKDMWWDSTKWVEIKEVKDIASYEKDLAKERERISQEKEKERTQMKILVDNQKRAQEYNRVEANKKYIEEHGYLNSGRFSDEEIIADKIKRVMYHLNK